MDLSELERLEKQQTQRNEVADVLRRAKALIGTPEKWLQGNFVDWDGGYRYCIAGAIIKICCGDGEGYRTEDLCGVMQRVIGKHPMTWNDAPERTHAEVLAAFDRAIELAERR